MCNEVPSERTGFRDAQIAEYRALSAPAVAGLMLGLLAPLAMIDPLLWIVPLVGTFVSGSALWRIARNAPVLSGRRAALTGLVLSLVFATAGPTGWAGYRWLIRREARQFALAWFGFLRHDEPHKARQLLTNPVYRPPLGDQLSDLYRDDPNWAEELKSYVARPLVRRLLDLGEKAQVRYYDTTAQKQVAGHDMVDQRYTVTYDEDGKRRAFFVAIKLLRTRLGTKWANWRITQAEMDTVPDGSREL
ncbi:MAG: hypothetical protein JXB62_08395 [Pirellulales bacterium]|nr:hypothetical protein [Pirellulales bacterium]